MRKHMKEHTPADYSPQISVYMGFDSNLHITFPLISRIFQSFLLEVISIILTLS